MHSTNSLQVNTAYHIHRLILIWFQKGLARLIPFLPLQILIVFLGFSHSNYLLSLDGNLWGAPEKEDGVPLTTSARVEPEETLNAHRRRKGMWNTFFLLACCIAVFIDPLFCYIVAISEDIKCFTMDLKLMWAYLCLRLILDVLYMIDIIISLLGIIRKKRNNIAKRFGACCWRTRSGHKTTVIRSPSSKGNQSIKASLYKLLPLLVPRILVTLPILEINILIILFMGLGHVNLSVLSSTLYITITIQYILRIYDIYASLRWRHLAMKTGIERWLKPILDFLPFILASHLFGALWYLFAIKRQGDCWKLNSSHLKGAQCSALKGAHECSAVIGANVCSALIEEACSSSAAFLGCEDLNLIQLIQPNFISTYASLSEKLCPVREENSTAFDFGIFRYALQCKQSFAQRVSQSFWWALRNLSSFGSNLNTSSSPLEIYFSILISISGMALFLVYLNARVQEAQESSKKRKMRKKKQLMNPNVDLWLSKNDLPKDLKLYEKKDLKTVIMENIHKLEKNKVIDVQSILSILPIHDRKQIIYLLCIASLRKVPLLESINENVLQGIVEHLKPASYNEDNYIFQQGKPLGRLLFITQGIAWTYTANGAAGTLCDSKWLKRGSFCGEELLHWAFKSPFFSDLPISTRNVISLEQIEAFSIRASDLKSVVAKFWWYFSMEVTSVSQLEQWEHLAAASIQAAWRRRCYHAKARGLSNWDKVMKVLN